MGTGREHTLSCISLLSVLILTIYLIFSSLPVFIGLDVQKNESGEWRVSNINKISWAAVQGIKVGDIITRVNRNPPDNHPTIKKFGVVEHIKTLEVRRDGNQIYYSVSNMFISEQLIYYTVIPTLIFTVLLLLIISLYKEKQGDRTAILLILFILAIGLSYLSASASARGDLVAKLITGISFLYAPFLFLHFLQCYFDRYNIRMISHRVLKVFYWFTGLLNFVNFIFALGDFGSYYFLLKRAQLVYFSIGVLTCLYVLMVSYLRYRNTRHNPVLKILIVGTLLPFFPFISLVIFPKLLFGKEWLPGPLAAIFLLFFPVFFIYFIKAQRLIDIDFFINRIRYFSMLVILPTALIVTFIFHQESDMTLRELVGISIYVFSVFLSFLYIKEKFSFLFRSKLFDEKYNFQGNLDRFFHDIVKVMKVSDLEERFIAEIKSVLDIHSVSLLEMEEKDLTLRLKRGHSEFPEQLIKTHLKNRFRPISAGQLNDIANGVLLIVSKNKNKYYLVWISEKINRIQLNRDERVWLKTIARYISLVYENLYFVEDLTGALEEAVTNKTAGPRWVSRFIFTLSEKERRRLAFDLHDSALQDQLLWYRRLESIILQYNLPHNLQAELNYVKDGLLDVIELIRETCNELRPPFLREIGIVEALEDLFMHVRLRANYAVHFDHSGFDTALDDVHMLALYRIVQELLRNTSRHSRASRVEVKLSNAGDKIYFHYRDNGIGMNLERYQPSFKHMGLYGIEERVASLEGAISLWSSPGKGFEVSIQMPVTVHPLISDQAEEDPCESYIIGR